MSASETNKSRTRQNNIVAYANKEVIEEVKKAMTTDRKTLIVIGHRLTTIANLTGGPDDLIVVLGTGGEILEQGSHQDLMNKRGEYFHLWKTQIGNIELGALYEKPAED